MSGEAALAMLERGVVSNSLRDGIPGGAPLIRAQRTDAVPPGAGLIVLSLPAGEGPNDRRYPVAVLGGTWRGLLTSGSTRMPGLVSVADIAPTALGEPGGLGSEASGDPVGELLALDRRIDERGDWRSRTATWLELATVGLAVAAPAAAVLGVAGALVANVVLGAVDLGPELGFALLLAAALSGLPLARRVRGRGALAAACAGAIGVYLVSFLVDERWVALSPLGPTQNARFYGITNLLETFVLVLALAGAWSLGRRRPLAAAGLAALALVTVAASRFGADGGGAVVLAAGFAVLAGLLLGGGRRAIASVGAGAAALVGLVLALDAVIGAESHVTRALGDGPVALWERLDDRVTLSWARATAETSTAVTIAVGLLALVVVLALSLRQRATLGERALPLAFAAAVAASLVVNDSPKDVALAGLAGYVAVEALALGPRSAAGRVRAILARGRPGPFRAR